eukprot:5578432-Prymnesium_polylepis.2
MESGFNNFSSGMLQPRFRNAVVTRFVHQSTAFTSPAIVSSSGTVTSSCCPSSSNKRSVSTSALLSIAVQALAPQACAQYMRFSTSACCSRQIASPLASACSDSSVLRPMRRRNAILARCTHLLATLKRFCSSRTSCKCSMESFLASSSTPCR